MATGIQMGSDPCYFWPWPPQFQGSLLSATNYSALLAGKPNEQLLGGQPRKACQSTLCGVEASSHTSTAASNNISHPNC